MLDPLTALGLASSIVQLITFSSSLISKSYEISKSADGVLVENLELEMITSSLQDLSNALVFSPGKTRKLDKTEKTLQELCDGCRNVAMQLLDVIRSLKAGSSNGRWNSFRQAMKSVWKEDQIEALLARLERYRRQIDTTLLLSLRQTIEKNGQGFAQPEERVHQRIPGSSKESAQWQADFLDTLQQNDWRLQNEYDMARFSSILSAGAKIQRDVHIRSRILDRLRFPTMKERFQRIPKAYKETFEWVLAEEREPALPHVTLHDEQEIFMRVRLAARGKLNRETSHRSRPWNSFVQWLQGTGTLYWITGKPGSGKSTLMKYLFNDPRTLKHLQCWTRSSPLVTAGFFFWNSGTAMQMSQMGLLQTLLYQTIESTPELIPSLFPDRWRSSELFGHDLHPWSLAELVAAFKTLISTEMKRFFFFIDGLDEFDGDTTELANFILDMSSKENVKMCVASRPWLVFEDAFQCQPSLRLEDLSAPDIHRFVSGNLGENRMFAQLQRLYPHKAERLVAEVTERACGVFLWVRLVVTSLLDGLRDGDSISDLMERLLKIPSDLEALFWKILGSLDPTYMEQASRLFQIVNAATTPPSLLTLSFAEEDFETVMAAEVKPISSDDVSFRAETVRRRLNSRCKGLIEASAFDVEGQEARVQYLHRTVKDFLARNDVWEYILSCTQNSSYDPDLKLCGAFLLQVKTLARRRGMLDDFWRTFKNSIQYSLRLESRDKDLHIAMVDELERAAEELFETRLPTGETLFETILSENRSYGRFVQERVIHWTATANISPTNTIFHERIETFFDYALSYPLCSYVEYRLNNGYQPDLSSASTIIQIASHRDPKGAKRLQGVLKNLQPAQMPQHSGKAQKASRSHFQQLGGFLKRFSSKAS